MDLDSMKYAELRSLAKELGIKANKMKAEKLLMTIKRHYRQQEDSVQGNEGDNVDPQVDINESQLLVQDDNTVMHEPDFNPQSFVTKRGKKSKRNISEVELPSTVSKENVVEADAGSAKRKRYSSTSGSGAIVPTEIGVNCNERPHNPDEVLADGVTDNGPKARKAGKIPRHEGLLNKSKALKPVTPNFKKLHEAHFKKMESIDSYVQRKQKQMKDLKKPTPGPASLFSPAPSKPADGKRRNISASKPVLKKPSQKEDALFRPSVLSTRRINVRFSQATQDNEHKMTLVKTPARKSTSISLGTPGKRNNNGGTVNPVKTADVSAMKTPGTFVFMGNESVNTPGNKKPCFDLKESLSRPLTYKPHTGKLKPFGENRENTEGNISQSHQKKYKQHQVETRDDRRVRHVKDRKQKKEDILGARRGLIMS